MSLKEYEFIDDADGPAGQALQRLANGSPWKASRLVTALEDFLRDELAGADRLAPAAAGGAAEVFLVPPRFVLAHLPDAAALVRVDHATRRVAVVEVIDICGGPGMQWAAIEVAAAHALVRP